MVVVVVFGPASKSIVVEVSDLEEFLPRHLRGERLIWSRPYGIFQLKRSSKAVSGRKRLTSIVLQREAHLHISDVFFRHFFICEYFIKLTQWEFNLEASIVIARFVHAYARITLHNRPEFHTVADSIIACRVLIPGRFDIERLYRNTISYGVVGRDNRGAGLAGAAIY